MVAMIEPYIDDLMEFGLAETRWGKMRQDQRTFADHLMSSWGYRMSCEGNYHAGIVRRAIKTALERLP